MNETSLPSHDVRYELIAENHTEDAAESPLSLLKRVLRGRLLFVAILAAFLGALGAVTGYTAVPPTYRSTGMVRVEGARSAILYESQENQVPPLFDALVSSQATYLRSRAVLDAAVQDSRLVASQWPAGPEGVARLQDALTVERGRGEQVISVSVSNHDPALAQTAVNAVLTAYRDLHILPQRATLTEKEQALVSRESQLTHELQELRERMLETSDQYGYDAIAHMHQSKVEELMAIDQKISELEIARANLDDPRGEGAGVVRVNDSLAQQLKIEEMELSAEIQSLRSKYGSNHPMIRELSRQLEAVRIQRSVHDNALADLVTPSDRPISPEMLAAASRARIDDLSDRFRSMRAQVREEAARLGGQRVALAALHKLVEETGDRLTETRKRLDELRLEATRDEPGRIQVASFGDLPVSPVTDRRRGLAGAGVLFGAVAGVGIVSFFGLINARARYVEELEAVDPQTPVIGLIPDLTVDPERNRRRAGRGIHQLRNLLELQVARADENVHAVTSCERGEGKTSVSLALATSFATAGRKTLIIDADVSRSALSRELQLQHLPGLCEAIGPSQGNAEVHATSQENLWAMPIGVASEFNPADLSRHRLEWLLDALRSRFEAIVIDTGSILCSVEACLVSAVADRAVIVVGRHQRVRIIRSSIDRLRQVSTRCAGLVFNQADVSDFKAIENDRPAETQNMCHFVEHISTAGGADALPLVSPVRKIGSGASPLRRAA